MSTIRAACAATLIAFAVCPTIVGHAQVPAGPDSVSEALMALKSAQPINVKWEQKKDTK